MPISEKTDADEHSVLAAGDSKSRPESCGSSKSIGSGNQDEVAPDQHVFSDPVVAEHWLAIYEKANYENRHRFDPTFAWSAEEERKLVRKIDKRIMVWAWVMFCALDLHRRNINRAITDNMLPELGKYTGLHKESKRTTWKLADVFV